MLIALLIVATCFQSLSARKIKQVSLDSFGEVFEGLRKAELSIAYNESIKAFTFTYKSVVYLINVVSLQDFVMKRFVINEGCGKLKIADLGYRLSNFKKQFDSLEVFESNKYWVFLLSDRKCNAGSKNINIEEMFIDWKQTINLFLGCFRPIYRLQGALNERLFPVKAYTLQMGYLRYYIQEVGQSLSNYQNVIYMTFVPQKLSSRLKFYKQLVDDLFDQKNKQGIVFCDYFENKSNNGISKISVVRTSKNQAVKILMHCSELWRIMILRQFRLDSKKEDSISIDDDDDIISPNLNQNDFSLHQNSISNVQSIAALILVIETTSVKSPNEASAKLDFTDRAFALTQQNVNLIFEDNIKRYYPGITNKTAMHCFYQAFITLLNSGINSPTEIENAVDLFKAELDKMSKVAEKIESTSVLSKSESAKISLLVSNNIAAECAKPLIEKKKEKSRCFRTVV